MLLSPAALVVGISLSVILLLYKFIIYPAFLSPFSNLPAPHWSCHIAPFWLWWAKYFHHENRLLHLNHLSKGVVLRLSPGILSVSVLEGTPKPLISGGFLNTELYSPGFPNTELYSPGFPNTELYPPPVPLNEDDDIFTFEDNADHLSRNRIIYNTFSNSVVLSSPTAQDSLNDVKPSNIEEGYANRLASPSDMFEHNSAAHETSGNTFAYAYGDPSRQPKVQKKLREEARTLEPLLKPPQTTVELTFLAAKDVKPCTYPRPPSLRPMVYTDLSPAFTPDLSHLDRGHDNIPAGTIVQRYAYVLHRTTGIFLNQRDGIPTGGSMQERSSWARCAATSGPLAAADHNVRSVYSNCTPTIHDHGGNMTLIDAYLAGPKGHRLQIKFEKSSRVDHDVK
ncbi:unnamed protein product, partial [Clonostachys rhizophaga]